jgi:phenol hydroxylase P0 protein
MRSSSPASAATPISVDTLPACDTTRRYVRVLEERADGLVAFEFAIGWPELSVELLLPAAAFAEFCVTNRVVVLDRHSLSKNEWRHTP